mmetsp:Transcript_45109/g.79377  ORF Transcript_45109/g.79377 Transcript_45109/m.79377 type:complete len:327 (+) Transcript_45109:150-1130(+)
MTSIVYKQVTQTETDQWQAVTKNTFIDMVLPSGTCGQRSSSVPRSMRLNDGTIAIKAPKLEQRLLKEYLEAPQQQQGRLSDASTDACSASDEDSVDSGNVCAPKDSTSSQKISLRSSAEPYTPQVSQGSNMVYLLQTPLAPDIQAQALQDAEPPERTKLSSQAKVWTPVCTLRSKPPGTKLNKKARRLCGRLRWQCHEVAAAAEKAMSLCMYIVSAELVMERSSWSIIAHIRPEHFHFKEQVLSAAKQSLLDNAEQSDQVYVLGYRKKPFMTTPLGFFVMLGTMSDPQQACWEYFCNGCCARDEGCSWQHPAFMVTVNVMVKLAVD